MITGAAQMDGAILGVSVLIRLVDEMDRCIPIPERIVAAPFLPQDRGGLHDFGSWSDDEDDCHQHRDLQEVGRCGG
jgi:hypothetical protein